jgi:pyridoxamine 5'-phosphate oxidase family protein
VIVMGGSVFTPAELAYLHEGRRLGRVATVGRDGTPHVVPSGWTHNRELDTIDVTGRAVENTKKFRDVVRSGRAAIVIDDIASVNPFRPRAIEVRGTAEAVREPEALIRIHPRRIVSWGIEDRGQARTVNADRAADRLGPKHPTARKRNSTNDSDRGTGHRPS